MKRSKTAVLNVYLDFSLAGFQFPSGEKGSSPATITKGDSLHHCEILRGPGEWPKTSLASASAWSRLVPKLSNSLISASEDASSEIAQIPRSSPARRQMSFTSWRFRSSLKLDGMVEGFGNSERCASVDDD